MRFFIGSREDEFYVLPGIVFRRGGLADESAGECEIVLIWWMFEVGILFHE